METNMFDKIVYEIHTDRQLCNQQAICFWQVLLCTVMRGRATVYYHVIEGFI